MDFYVDLAVAVLLRLLKDRRKTTSFFAALAKVHRELDQLYEQSSVYAAVKDKRVGVGP